jgi:hypothetical protein
MPDEKPSTSPAQATPESQATEAAVPASGCAKTTAPLSTREKAEPAIVPGESKAAPSTNPGETMEIHTPDKPIHTKKEFMFHMFTVVLGILIALGLEGIVEWAHHRALVREARANIATELRHNRETIAKALPELKARQQQLRNIISLAAELEKTHKLNQQSVGFDFSSYELYSTAWKTASVSGAVTYMDYEELKNYTDAYDDQQNFITVQNLALPTIGELSAAMQALNRDLSKTPDGKLDEIQKQAIRLLSIEEALESEAVSLNKDYKKALQE